VIQVREALVAFGYREQPDARAELAAGEFRFVPEDTSLVEVFLLRNRYGWTMIGLTKDGDSTLCLACEGDPHANRGHILASAAQRLIDAGAWNAVLIDEGADMFQAALLKGGGGPPLQATIPLKRTRLRATFVFGRRRASEGGG
jgi:hypothetical protein